MVYEATQVSPLLIYTGLTIYPGSTHINSLYSI